MKKKYMLPETTAIEIQTQQLVAMSLQNGQADENMDVLSREQEDLWDVWDEDEGKIK